MCIEPWIAPLFCPIHLRSIALLTPDGSTLKYFLISSEPRGHRPLGLQLLPSTAAGCVMRFKQVLTARSFGAW